MDILKELHIVLDIIAKEYPACNIAIDKLQRLMKHPDLSIEVKKSMTLLIENLFLGRHDMKSSCISTVKSIGVSVSKPFVRDLLLVNRFCKQGKDIGSLSILPELALMEIQQGVIKII